MGIEVLPAGLGSGIVAFFTTGRGARLRPPYGGLNLSCSVGDDPRAVEANRAEVARALSSAIGPGGTGGDPLTWSRPMHGCDVAVIGPDGEAEPAVDALVSTWPGRGVAVLAADCVPVLLVARVGGAARAVGAVHCGRRGVTAEVVPAAVAALRAAVDPEADISAAIGPAICAACYEVPAQMREEVCAVEPAAWATSATGTPALDLPSAVEHQLHRLGASVRRSPLCTRETPWLYSHRRGDRGRTAGVIALRHADPDVPGQRALAR